MLFKSIMMTSTGPRWLKYNARFGDTEAQALLPPISKKADPAKVMIACIEGFLDEVEILIDNKSCAVVVIASGGYPYAYCM